MLRTCPESSLRAKAGIREPAPALPCRRYRNTRARSPGPAPDPRHSRERRRSSERGFAGHGRGGEPEPTLSEPRGAMRAASPPRCWGGTLPPATAAALPGPATTEKQRWARHQGLGPMQPPLGLSHLRAVLQRLLDGQFIDAGHGGHRAEPPRLRCPRAGPAGPDPHRPPPAARRTSRPPRARLPHWRAWLPPLARPASPLARPLLPPGCPLAGGPACSRAGAGVRRSSPAPQGRGSGGVPGAAPCGERGGDSRGPGEVTARQCESRLSSKVTSLPCLTVLSGLLSPHRQLP